MAELLEKIPLLNSIPPEVLLVVCIVIAVILVRIVLNSAVGVIRMLLMMFIVVTLAVSLFSGASMLESAKQTHQHMLDAGKNGLDVVNQIGNKINGALNG